MEKWEGENGEHFVTFQANDHIVWRKLVCARQRQIGASHVHLAYAFGMFIWHVRHAWFFAWYFRLVCSPGICIGYVSAQSILSWHPEASSKLASTHRKAPEEAESSLKFKNALHCGGQHCQNVNTQGCGSERLTAWRAWSSSGAVEFTL